MKKLITRLFLLLIIGITTLTQSNAGCLTSALPPTNSTSGNARAPIGNFRFIRGVYIITPAELAASGIVNGDVITQIGWSYSTAHNISVAGTLKVYFQNTSDVSFLKGTSWATNTSTMTLASNAADVIPASQYFNHTLSGAPAFTYTGGGLYVAYEWSNPLNALSTGAFVSCNTATNPTAGLVSAQSNTALPVTLGASVFRPATLLTAVAGSNLCPCIPTSVLGGGGDRISVFNFASLNYGTTGGMAAPAYRTMGPTSIISAAPGVPYPITVSNGFAADADEIWIDFNDNGIFDDVGEMVFQGPAGTTVTGTITLPLLSPLGLHKLRIRNYDTSSGDPIGTVTPCSTVQFGETKDFILNIVAPFNDIQVTNIYTLGKVAIEYGSPMTISARINNGGSFAQTNYNVHLNVQHAGVSSFSHDTTISLTPGANGIVTFAPYTPVGLSSADTITVSVASDADNSNNTQTWVQAVTQNLYSYKNPLVANLGGVGFNGGTGDFVAKFNSHIGTNFPYNVYSPQINQIAVDFFTTNGETYNLGIWDATGPGGTPGNNLWTSANLTQAAGTAFIPVPNISVSGDYYVGVRQTGVANISFAYQNESPIRTGTFYFTSPTGTNTWTDFTTFNSNFRFSIVAQVRIPQAPDCPGNLTPSNLSMQCPASPVTVSWTSGGGAVADNYDVYLSTNQADVIAHAPSAKVSAAQVGTSYTTPGLLTPGATYYWTVIGNSISEALSSNGCTVQSFTMLNNFMECYCVPEHPPGCDNGNITNVTVNTLNNTSTCSAPAYTVYPAGPGTTTTLNNGVTYNLSVTTDDICIISVWIDWNQNGVFESSEWSQITLGSGIGVPSVIPITVPIGALQGQTRMRIRSRFGGNINGSTDACTSFGSGESEDYTITVSLCSGTPDPGNTISSLNSVCPGVPFDLSLQNQQVPSGINYQWQSTLDTNSSWTNIGANSSVHTTSQTAPTYYRCIVTCTVSSLSQTSNPIHVLLNNVAKPYLSTNDTSLCSNNTGLTISVKDSGLYAGGYPSGTLFDFIGYTGPTPYDTLFVINTDLYFASVKLPISIGGCTSTTGTSLIEFGVQAPQLSMTFDSVICKGQSNGNAIASIVFGGVPRYRWQWYNASNVLLRDVTNSATTDILTGQPAGWYTVVLTDHQDSLTSPYCQVTDMVYIEEPLVLATPTITGVSPVCSPAMTTFTANAGYYSYHWSTGATTQSINTGTPGVYTVTVANYKGCTKSASKSLVVAYGVPAVPAVILGPNSVCKLSTANFSVVNVPSATSYTWTVGAGATITLGQGTNAITVSFTNTAVASMVTVYATNVCGSSNIQSLPYVVHAVLPTTPTTINGSLFGNCNKLGVAYNCPAVANATSYAWTVPAGVNIITGQGTTAITVNYTGAFTNTGNITVSAVNGCGSSAPQTRTTSARPAQPVISGQNYACPNQSGLIYTVAPIVGATYYTWTPVPGSTILGGQGTTSITLKWGTVGGVLKCTANNGCGVSVVGTKSVSIVCKEMGSAFDFSEMNLYPNPATTTAMLQFDGYTDGEGQLLIYDLIGNQQFKQDVNVQTGLNQFELKLSNFAKGIYSVQLVYNGLTRNTKLIVQ